VLICADGDRITETRRQRRTDYVRQTTERQRECTRRVKHVSRVWNA